MTKERRDELRAECRKFAGIMMGSAELLALLDADERLEGSAFSAEEVQLTREAFAAWVGEHDTGGEEYAWPEIPVILKKMER